MRARLVVSAIVALALAVPSTAAQYAARRTGDVVRLEDTGTRTVVSILPSFGNVTFEMLVKGQNVLRWPYASLDEFKARPALSGIPFLGPWANRLDEQAFYANGTKYAFDMGLGNVRGAIPIHGFLSQTNQWQVVELKADGTSARITSRLDFFKQPAWMKQFPFAHTIEMTHRLQDGVLYVQTKIVNMSADPMPVAIGFHPYFQLTDADRDEWTISIPARTHWVLASTKVPTGQTEPIAAFMPAAQAASLKDYNLDDVFSDLVRDREGRATMSLKGKQQRLDITVGPQWRALVVYAPKPTGAPSGPSNRFICFEPMAGITDAMNLAQRELYKELQSIPPGGTWQESFWIRPSGF